MADFVRPTSEPHHDERQAQAVELAAGRVGLSPIDFAMIQNQDTERPAVAWANGALTPLLWLAVVGYQALVLMLKVVNRERPVAHAAVVV